MGIALVVCCALVASAKLQNEESVLYGIGSGEEQEGANAIVTTFETFKDQEEMIEKEVRAVIPAAFAFLLFLTVLYDHEHPTFQVNVKRWSTFTTAHRPHIDMHFSPSKHACHGVRPL